MRTRSYSRATFSLLELIKRSLSATLSYDRPSLLRHPMYAVHLWPTVMEWQFYQMGFQVKESPVKTKYDFQALYTNLKARTRVFSKLPLPEIKPEVQQQGQIIWIKTDEGMKAWIVFENKRGMVAGLMQDLSGGWLKPKWYGCETEPKKRRECAELALKSTERSFILITKVKTTKILWVLTGDDEEQQWTAMVLEYPAQQKGYLQWIKLSEPPLEMYKDIMTHFPAIQGSSAEKSVNKYLKSITTTEIVEVRIICNVNVDLEKKVYELVFNGDDFQEALKFHKTSDLVKMLRHPIRIGAGLEVASGRVLMWDHLKDIDYGEVRIEHDNKTEYISLSFLKPLVHRSRFFPEEYSVPETCTDLLDTKMNDNIRLVVKTSDISYRSLRVELEDIPDISLLKRLEDMEMNIFDVALLSECEQLIDTSTGTRHNVEIDATNLLGVNFSKIDAYPKLKTALERADVTNFDWSIGLWSLDYTFENEWLKWGIYTRSGDDPWGKELYLFYLDCTLNLHEIIDKFKDEVSKIIPLKHISDIDAILKNLQDELRNEGWGDETPECRIEISKGIGKYKIIVRLMESGKRIDEIDLPDEVNRENIGDYTDYLFSEGIFSGLNIINKDDFYTELYSVLLGNDEEY